MEKEYIAIIDSGIGGISTLLSLKNEMPTESYIYYGDNKNTPYGNKSKKKILSLVYPILTELLNYKIKCLVIGCNTMSVAIKKEIEDYIAVKTFGVFPPIEQSLVSGKNTLLLSTANTAMYYEKYKADKNFHAIGFFDLAKEIENNFPIRQKINFENHVKKSLKFGFNQNEETKFDNLILGCTHYYFIKNEISNHFFSEKIIDGNFYTTINVKKYIRNLNSLEKSKGNEILFLGKDLVKNMKTYEYVVKNGL